MQDRIRIALAGNPNSGKSTLFNALTGLNQKVANFPGVTVDSKTGRCSLRNPSTGETIKAEIIDLPGTYSLYPKSPDERIPFQVLCDPDDPSHPDIVVVIADASNLKRSLFLCTQIIDLKKPVVLALNMMDLVREKGLDIDVEGLSKKLGVPVVPIVASRREGLEILKKSIFNAERAFPDDFIDIHQLSPCVLSGIREVVKVNSSYAAFQIANNLEIIPYFSINQEKKDRITGIIREFGFDASKLQVQETLERYKVISSIINEFVTHREIAEKRRITERIDNVLTHRIWGYVFFFLNLFLIFQAVFSWSSYPMEGIQQGFTWLSGLVRMALPAGILNDLLVNGILAGISGIVVFVPQIALLFMFIAILEDTGYMSRVSFLMDRVMKKFGLSGRSLIPMVSGVACAVPAIMSARTIQNRKERILTIMVTPLMSCSARIPVYTLLISMVVPDRMIGGIINMQGLALMLLYLTGFLAAIGAAWVMKLLIKTREKSYFIMEMPVYRMPHWTNVGHTMIEKVKVFLFDAGKIIVAISVILWVLSSYGPKKKFEMINQKYTYPEAISSMPPAEVSNHIQSEKLEASYAGIMGRWMEPVIKPLGFDWKIGIALLTSFAAREVFVGTMATLYSVGSTDVSTASIRDRMMQEKDPADNTRNRYSPAVAISLILFYAFAMQCMSTVAVVHRETKSWKWPLLQIVYMSGLAYLASLCAYQVLS